MTGLEELTQIRVIDPAPEHVRLSILGQHCQFDVTVPLDAPIAYLIPDLVAMLRSRSAPKVESDEQVAAKESNRDYWALTRIDSAKPLDPSCTLRDAGVGNGQLLRLVAERALSAPILYDDVVDATARLNKAAYSGWDRVSAQWMAFAGVHLVSLAWVFLLVSPACRPHRPVLAGIGAAAALTLVGAAALAHRSYRLDTIGTALGWAAVPITVAAIWAGATPFGPFGLAGGCAAAALLMYVYYRVATVGHAAYIATGLCCALLVPALIAAGFGVRPAIVGGALAVIATFGCFAVPGATARFGRLAPPRVADADDEERPMFENPFLTPAPAPTAPAPDVESGVTNPAAEDVWARVLSATLARAAIYAGLAGAAVTGAVIVLRSEHPPHWSAVAFAFGCAVVLGLHARRPASTPERAVLGVSGAALLAVTAAVGQAGPSPMALAGFGVVTAAALLCALIGLDAQRSAHGRVAGLLAWLEYPACAALLPLAAWVAGVYDHVGPR